MNEQEKVIVNGKEVPVVRNQNGDVVCWSPTTLHVSTCTLASDCNASSNKDCPIIVSLKAEGRNG